MDPLSVTASAIAIIQISGTIINLCYDYRSRVKNAAKESGRIVSELNGLRSVIDSLFVLLDNEATKSNHHSALDKLAEDGGPLKRCLTGLEALEKKLQPKEGWRAMREAIIWPLKESEVTMLLRNINSTKSTVQLALAVDQRKATSVVQNDVALLTRQASDSIVSARRDRILRWLAAANSFSNHAAARRQCQTKTGIWFLEGAKFEQWSLSPNSFFWIHGIPGCGKTILCSSIIDKLSIKSFATARSALAYFYFDFTNNKGSRVESLIRSIIAQLFTQKADTPPALDELFDQSREGANGPLMNDLVGLLLNVLKEFSTVYIIIDALDECSDLNEMLQVLYEIRQWNLENVHILVTSRQIPEIESSLSELSADAICLHESFMDDDISLYIAEKLRNDQRLRKWPPDVRELISKTLHCGASGMFRWVACQLDSLRECINIHELKRRLSELPKTLEETYDQTLLQIDENRRDSALKILQWLAFAALPVTVEEAAEVLTVDLSIDGCYNADLKLLDPHDIMLLCSSLIKKVKTSAYDEPELSWPHNEYYLRLGTEFVRDEPEKEIVRLAHLSVRDYLVSNRIKCSRAFLFATDAKLANTFIAQTCLIYLLHPAFASGFCDEETIKRRNLKWPLYQYAAHFWPFHVNASGEILNETTWNLLQRFFGTQKMANGGNFAAWAVALTPDTSLNRVLRTKPLYYAASFGVTSLIRKLLDSDQRIEIDATGGRFDSPPLQVAAYRNHPATVKLLLEAGADPMAPNCFGNTSLYWATMREHLEVRRLLESYGATFSRHDLHQMRNCYYIKEVGVLK